jgi:hypothetical protein
MSKADQIRALRERQYEEHAQRLAQQAAVGSPAALALSTVGDAVTNVINSVAKTVAERQAKWRTAHPDINRNRAREGMRKLRAAKK